jgi:hypothetical protein
MTSSTPPFAANVCSARICMSLPHDVHRLTCDTSVSPVHIKTDTMLSINTTL